MIRRVHGIARLHVVPVPHTNDATYAVDSDGRRWVAKREAEMGAQALVAEAAAWLLAPVVGARLPEAAFCDDPHERAWLSAVVPSVTHWFPALATRVSNPADVGAMLALDVLIQNEARHARNVLAEVLPDGGVRIWAIDADEALIGMPGDYAARLADLPRVHNHARGLPLEAIAGAARSAAQAAARHPAAEIRARIAEACSIGGEPEAAELGDLVVRRAGALPELVEHYLKALGDLR